VIFHKTALAVCVLASIGVTASTPASASDEELKVCKGERDFHLRDAIYLPVVAQSKKTRAENYSESFRDKCEQQLNVAYGVNPTELGFGTFSSKWDESTQTMQFVCAGARMMSASDHEVKDGMVREISFSGEFMRIRKLPSKYYYTKPDCLHPVLMSKEFNLIKRGSILD
jgi:hypothetical protein